MSCRDIGPRSGGAALGAFAASAALFALFAVGLAAGRGGEKPRGTSAAAVASFDVTAREEDELPAPEPAPVEQPRVARIAKAPSPVRARSSDLPRSAAGVDPLATLRPPRDGLAPSAAAVSPPPAPPSIAVGDDALAAYATRLRLRILARRPAGARGAGEVTVRFRITREGALADSVIEQSSGTVRLDRIALRMVRQAAPFPAPDPAIVETQLVFSLPIRFH